MHALAHHDLVVAPLASGSRGNCTYVGTHERGVLVDCGISAKQVLERMEAIGLGDAQIDGVLVTHEHSDHVAAAGVLDRKLAARQGKPVPFYLSGGTAEGAPAKCLPSQMVTVRSGQPFVVGRLTVEPFTIPHDTLDPLAFLLRVGDLRVGVITDLGRATALVERQLASCDVAVLEFNHDLTMLLDGAYPWATKQRIRSHHGHLSNDQAADLLAAAAPRRLAHLVLAHLSADNNDPDVAREAAERALFRAGLRHTEVHVARQSAPLRPVGVSTVIPAPQPETPAFMPVQASLFGGW